jgi:hypothetical protein
MRKRKFIMILIIGLAGYFMFVLFSSGINKYRWDVVCTNGLLNLYRSWTNDNQPTTYNVERYYQSPSTIVQFYPDSNYYTVNDRTVTGLFAAKYTWEGKPVVFVVARDGTLYRYQNSQTLRIYPK